jgi:hypothetical protein
VAEYGNSSTGKENTFGRSLMNYVNTYLPYGTYNTLDTIEKLNPKFVDFQDTGSKRSEALSKHSISSNTQFNNDSPSAFFNIDTNFTQYMYANIQADKISRLRDYRVMAAFAEVANALDEICDECINKDDNGLIIKVIFKNDNLPSSVKTEIEEEFQKYIEHFELEESGWEYFRNILTDGEIYFEHVIHKDYTEAGILGALLVPTELIDPIFGNVQNMIIKGYLLRKPIFDPSNPTKILDYQLIPLDKNQITYINSGTWNENKTMRIPFIENCRRAYRQLSLIEDSIVIYRLARAPERLVFNVDVGNMAPPKAEAYIKRLMQSYWSKRTYDSSQGGQVNKFNPQSYLDNYWFAKRQGSEGTTVQSLPGAQNLDQLAEINYFQEKLYESLKVPIGRLNAESAINDSMTMLREELRFAKFLVRLQQHFATGLKNGFITHLKLKKMWEKSELKESLFNLEFTPPTNFYELRESQKLEIKANAFNQMTQNESISKTYAQRKYLKWSDKEVLINREFLRKDREFEWELAQIQAAGPNWKKQGGGGEGVEGQPMAAGSPGGMTPEGGAAGGTSPGAGSETPPEFGPPPAEAATGGSEAEAETPAAAPAPPPA